MNGYSQEVVTRVLQKAAAGMSAREIARQEGLSNNTISRWIRGETPGPNGEAKANGELAQSRVEAISAQLVEVRGLKQQNVELQQEKRNKLATIAADEDTLRISKLMGDQQAAARLADIARFRQELAELEADFQALKRHESELGRQLEAAESDEREQERRDFAPKLVELARQVDAAADGLRNSILAFTDRSREFYAKLDERDQSGNKGLWILGRRSLYFWLAHKIGTLFPSGDFHCACSGGLRKIHNLPFTQIEADVLKRWLPAAEPEPSSGDSGDSNDYSEEE